MQLIIIAIGIVVLAVVFLALGLILRSDKSKGELKGSCGGPNVNPDCCQKKSDEKMCEANNKGEQSCQR